MRGFDRRGAAAAICEASTTGFKAYGVFRDMADFAVVILYDADNYFEHYRLKHLPDFDFTGIVLIFDLNYDGIEPIDSPKFNWIDWATLDVLKESGEPAYVKLWDYAKLQAGSFGVASGTFTFQTNTHQGFDRVTIWLNNAAFDYIIPGKIETEFQFFAAGSGTVHTITVDGRTYAHTETAGQGSADVANSLIALVNAGAGDADASASVGTVSYAVKIRATSSAGTSFSVSASGGTTETLWRVQASTVAANIRDQINGANWPALSPTMAVLASVSGAALTVKAARYGYVNTSGVNVTLSSGDKFTGIAAGSAIYIDGVGYTVASLTSPDALTLTSSAGTQSGKKYLAERGGYDGNMLTLYSIWKNNGLKTTASSVKLSGGNSGVTWRVSLDFSALGLTAIRQMWLTFAAKLPDSATYTATEWTATISNWAVTDPSSKRPLKVAGPGSVRVDSRDAWVTYTGASWVEEASAQPGGTGWFHGGFARRALTTGDKVTIKYSCQSVHDLWLGTSLYSDRGIVSVTLDGGAATTLDCFLNNEPPVVTRRKLRSSVAAGTHTVEIELTGTKHAAAGAWDVASSNYYFYFDYLEAVIAGDVPDPEETYSYASPAIDYSTDHTYKQTPQRLLWNFDKLGFHGHMNEYIGVFWWNQRKRVGGVFKTLTVTFGGTFAGGDEAYISIGGFMMGKSIFPADTPDTIAAHFVHFINGTLVAMWAETTATAGQLKIHVRTPIWSDTNAVSVVSTAGTVSTAGDLLAGTEGSWVIDDAAANPINFPTRKWHSDLFDEVATRGRKITVACSMELVTPPDDPTGGDVWAARFGNGVAVETDVGFASLKSTHCSFVPAMTNYQKEVFKELAHLQDAAGLEPWLQFGEFLWWFFSSKALSVANITGSTVTASGAHLFATGDRAIIAGTGRWDGTRTITVTSPTAFTVSGTASGATWNGAGQIRGGSMAYYDDDTQAAALSSLGRPLALFTCQDDDPTVNASADANFLAGRIKSHIDAIRAHVLATYANAKFELLWPNDVNNGVCYHTASLPFPQGGRLNYAVNTPAAYLSKTGSGLDRMKIEALSWGSFYRNLDLAKESCSRAITSPWGWPLGDVAYLIPNFNGGAFWPAEWLEAKAQSIPLINFWAYDHIALMGWPVPMPKPKRRSQFI